MYNKVAIPYGFLAALIMLLLSFSCQRKEIPQHIEAEAQDSISTNVLEDVVRLGKLKVLTEYNSLNYFVYKGEPMGYQYEMLKAFCNHMDIRLELNIERNFEQAMDKLERGDVHLIALGFTITKERKQRFDFTDPILRTRQVLVQRLPKNWRRFPSHDQIESELLRNSLDLAGKTIHVQAGTIFKKRLETLMDEIADTIYIIEDARDVEELIDAVASGKIEYTVADEYLAMQLIRSHDNLDIKTPISFEQKLAWAVKKEAHNELLEELNYWLRDYFSSTDARMLYTKYFGPNISHRSRSDFHSLKGSKLSDYDDIIKKAAQNIGWDWRLLASLIYQESEFKPQSVSWAGAYGLMQLMPVVMEQFNIDTTATAEQHISAGTKYLLYLDRLIPEMVTDSNERIKFILAAYNSGVGHVLDARRLAEKYNKDPNQWTGNVDFFMRNKSKPTFYNDSVAYYGYVRGEETFRFVEQILDRYEHYCNLLPSE